MSAAKKSELEEQKSFRVPVGPFEFDANDSCVGSSGLIRLATLRPTGDNEAFLLISSGSKAHMLICSYILEALAGRSTFLMLG